MIRLHPAVIAALAGVAPVALAGDPAPHFTERAIDAGCAHVHTTVTNAPDLEFMAAGGVVADFDRDGDQDFFAIGGSTGHDRLYLNDGSGNFTDVSVAAGVNRTHRGVGAAAGDYDNDGDIDIYVTSIGSGVSEGPGTNLLYRNNGNGTFTNVAAAAGVTTTNPNRGDSYGAAFGDYDLDGDLDLAVSGYFGASKLFRNNGDGTFTDVTLTALPSSISTMRAFAPRFLDMDGDRYPEILWVADFYTSRYLVNNGNGTFSDATASSGTGLDSNGMGNAYADLDNDGDYDWYVTSRISPTTGSGSGNMLYMQGPTPHVFTETSVAAGANLGYWGWGSDAQDFDHDGDADIVATNGFTGEFATDPTRFFVNDGSANFTEASAAYGLTDTNQGRGLLTSDLDNDGDRDILIFNNRQPMLLYRNNVQNPGGTAITIAIDTRGIEGVAPDGFGTLITATTHAGGPVTQRRTIDGGSNYLAQSELSAHFGLGGATYANISITYPDGVTDSFPNVAPGRYTITRLACPADFTRDGNVNFFDLSTFIGLYGQRHPMGDFTRDGVFNFFDISNFINAFNAGCP